MKEIKTAEILCVGTELLLGDIVNTNAAYLSRKLAEMGISVYHQSVVGDNAERLKKSLEEALGRCDLIILSGGLGPTYDDLTKETTARVLGEKLVLSEPLLKGIRAYFSDTHRIMTKNNEKQAMIPEGGIVFKNNYGTAPGIGMTDKKTGTVAILLPGPPRELEPMFIEEVMPYLESRRGNVLASRNVQIFGMGESAVETVLKDLMESSLNPTLAPYCKDGEVRLRVTAKAETRSKALSFCNQMIDKIKATQVGQFIYGIDCGTIECEFVHELAAVKKTVAVAESCTGGLIAKRITDIPGSSEVFAGGAVTYANEAKIKIAGVSRETLEKHGAVSEKVAIEMARGIRTNLGTDIGISTTGIAGPGGGTPEKPVGTVYVGISTAQGDHAFLLSLSSRRDRAYIRTLAASNAMIFAMREIRGQF